MGWKMVDRMSQPPPTPRGLFTLVCSGDVTQHERGALGKCGAYLGIICFVSLLEGTRQDTCGGSKGGRVNVLASQGSAVPLSFLGFFSLKSGNDGPSKGVRTW